MPHLLTEKLQRLDDIPEIYTTGVEAAQSEILAGLVSLMNSLETKGGVILLNERNFATINLIIEGLNEVVFDSEYQTLTIEFLSQFDQQAIINNQYIKSIESRFEEKALYAQIQRAGKRDAAILLSESAVATEFLEPIRIQLETSVSTSQTMRGAIQSMNDFVLGTEKFEGALTRYTKQVAFDAFAFADRKYTQTVSEDLGLVWRLYSGGLISDSRVFCVERNGKIFHIKEVEKWGTVPAEWQGRVNTTNPSNIFTFLGGWNCRHSIMPVGETQVPPSVLARNKAKGNI